MRDGRKQHTEAGVAIHVFVREPKADSNLDERMSKLRSAQRARGRRAACSCTHATAVCTNNAAPGMPFLATAQRVRSVTGVADLAECQRFLPAFQGTSCAAGS